jgi:uncharacterized protein
MEELELALPSSFQDDTNSGDSLSMRSNASRCVYVDYDDILCETALGFAHFVERQFGKKVAFDDITSFDLGVSFGLSLEDTAELMRLMHEPPVLRGLKPVSGASAGLRRWKKAGWEIFVVTGRPPATREVSDEWLRSHLFPFDRLIFVDKYSRNHPPHDAASAVTLPELCAMPFCLAIEDSPVMIRYVQREMKVPLVILDRPWNRKEEERAGAAPVIRCRDWRQILRRFPEPCWTEGFAGVQ